MAFLRGQNSNVGAVRHARKVLWIVVLTAAVFIAAYLPHGSLANTLSAASPTGSPTGTVVGPINSASPTPPNQPSPLDAAIQLINTSKYQTPQQISSKKDEDETFHLVAWVANAPADALVEFQISQGVDEAETFETIGTAEKVGTDTYEFHWDTTEHSGDYKLHAILAWGEGETAKDEETVKVNNTLDTVEITSPANGDPLAIYDPPDADLPAFVLETTTSGVVTAGAGPKTPRVIYSTSAPGSEPSWKNCYEQRTILYSDTPQGRQRIGCILRSNDKPEDVRLVGVVARSQPPNTPFGPGCTTMGGCPQPETDQSGDAHRVAPYLQAPTSIEIVPEAAAATATECMVRSAVLKDQSGHPIWRGQVDVHATGPSDQLQFVKHAQSSPFQRPDSGHSRLEPAGLCGNQTGEPRQADHEVVNGLDTKHIETTVAGTGIEGGFTYALRSPDAEGKTVELAWADVNQNDVFDCGEPADWGKITWSQPATPVAQPTTAPTEGVPPCGEPSPTGSPTATPTSTPTGTATQEPTQSPTSTPSSSPTTALQSEQTLTLASPQARATAGRTIKLTGDLSSVDPTCHPSGVQVTISRRIHGTTETADVAAVSTDVGGGFSSPVKVRRSADYVARVSEHDHCAAATSTSVTVLARVKVRAAPVQNVVHHGSTVKIRGSIRPKHPGTRVLLQIRKGKKWTVIDKSRTNIRSRFRLATRATWFASRTFRVKWPSSDKDHITSFSRKFKVASA